MNGPAVARSAAVDRLKQGDAIARKLRASGGDLHEWRVESVNNSEAQEDHRRSSPNPKASDIQCEFLAHLVIHLRKLPICMK